MKTIEIGRVIKPHGLTGEVKVRLHWRESQALFDAESLRVCRYGAADVELTIDAVRATPEGPILKLAGIDDRDAAEALRGARLHVSRGGLPPLEPGEYYLSDLIGWAVLGPDGAIGEVLEVVTHPSVDSIVIRLADGSTAEQPMVEQWIDHVDVDARRIVLRTTDALIEAGR